MKFWYYAKNFGRNALPSLFFRWNYQKIKRFEAQCDPKLWKQRLEYYFKIQASFPIPEEAVAIKDFKRNKGTGYYFDLKEFLHYFKKNTRISYHFGDETHVNPYPTLFKARPIEGDNQNSILFKLNKHRHFIWVNDTLSFEDKKDHLVWRGGAYWPNRRAFVEKFWNHPRCNVGQTNRKTEDVPWQKPRLTKEEQLQYKFIFCIEGNDVATSLKWIMSSNSLCIMPKPKCETWFMEGTLIPGKHYVEVKDDFSDVLEKMDYYLKHPEKAKEITRHANQFAQQFMNPKLEELLSLKVLENFTEFSGQKDALKF